MKITLTPERDSENSYPSEASSGVVLASDAGSNGEPARSLFVTLPDGREMTFAALDFAKALRALAIV